MNNQKEPDKGQPAETAIMELLPLEVTGIRPQQRNKERCSLFHKEKFLIGVSIQTLTETNVKKGDVCTVQLYKKLQQAEHVHTIREAALRYLARRAHSTQELRQKLQKKNFGPENIEMILHECTSKNWLNDTNFAKAFAKEKAELNNWGPQKIKNALYKKGISRPAADTCVKVAMENLQPEQICVDLAIKKKNKFLREKDLYKRKQKIYRYLAGKGFQPGTISSVLPVILHKLDV